MHKYYARTRFVNLKGGCKVEIKLKIVKVCAI